MKPEAGLLDFAGKSLFRISQSAAGLACQGSKFSGQAVRSLMSIERISYHRGKCRVCSQAADALAAIKAKSKFVDNHAAPAMLGADKTLARDGGNFGCCEAQVQEYSNCVGVFARFHDVISVSQPRW